MTVWPGCFYLKIHLMDEDACGNLLNCMTVFFRMLGCFYFQIHLMDEDVCGNLLNLMPVFFGGRGVFASKSV